MKVATKVKAFTLLELLVTMCVASLVISISLVIYQIIQQEHLRYNAAQTTMMDYYRSMYLMQQDIAFAQRIYIVEKQVICTFPEYQIRYKLTEDCIIRTQKENADTLELGVNSFICSYEELPVDQGLIDEVALKLNVFNEELSYSILKNYSADVLMEKDHNKITLDKQRLN